MGSLKKRSLFNSAHRVTVTRENLYEVTSEEFLGELGTNGCKAVVYVEYVPADGKTEYLAPGEEEREALEKRIRKLREEQEDMVFISFPGDERASGGCLAAGRGFSISMRPAARSPVRFPLFRYQSGTYKPQRGTAVSTFFETAGKRKP